MDEAISPELEQLRVPVPAWTWLVVALATAVVYALTLENGATLRAGASVLHEFFHDARHFISVPCH